MNTIKKDSLLAKAEQGLSNLDLRNIENAQRMRFPLYRMSSTPTGEFNYRRASFTGGSFLDLVYESSFAGNFRKQAITDVLVFPYTIKFQLEVDDREQGVYISNETAFSTGNISTAQIIGPFQSKVIGYTSVGTLYADGAVGSPANPFIELSPRLYTSTITTGFPRWKIFGFRELRNGLLELYDQRTDSWYSVNNSFMGEGRKVIVHLQSIKTYTIKYVN
jgi:hypothetical protein